VKYKSQRHMRAGVESRGDQSTAVRPWDAGSGRLSRGPQALWRRPPAGGMSSLLSWPSPMRQPRNVRVLTGSHAVLTSLCCLPWTLPCLAATRHCPCPPTGRIKYKGPSGGWWLFRAPKQKQSWSQSTGLRESPDLRYLLLGTWSSELGAWRRRRPSALVAGGPWAPAARGRGRGPRGITTARPMPMGDGDGRWAMGDGPGQHGCYLRSQLLVLLILTQDQGTSR
jgi:hypothetical protein